jgi:predicted enzyme related to lactoylglutathione lyase
MLDPTYFLLYVDDPIRSGAFYGQLLGRSPVESSATFVMFVLDSGVKLGFWARPTVLPQATGSAGASELAIALDNVDAVRAMHDDWRRRDVPIIQAPTDLDFGHTFVALDPDGHRIRVFAPVAP